MLQRLIDDDEMTTFSRFSSGLLRNQKAVTCNRALHRLLKSIVKVTSVEVLKNESFIR